MTATRYDALGAAHRADQLPNLPMRVKSLVPDLTIAPSQPSQK
jgi:hypothetical protein